MGEGRIFAGRAPEVAPGACARPSLAYPGLFSASHSGLKDAPKFGRPGEAKMGNWRFQIEGVPFHGSIWFSGFITRVTRPWLATLLRGIAPRSELRTEFAD